MWGGSQPEEMPQGDIVRVGILEKKIISNVVSWEERNAVLTWSHLCCSSRHENQSIIQDKIPLHEVTNVFIEGSSPGRSIPRQPAEASADDEMRATLGRLAAEDSSKYISHGKDAPQVMVIRTELWGHNFGRTFFYRSVDDVAFEKWFHLVTSHVKHAKKRFEIDEAVHDKSELEKQVWKVRRKLRSIHDKNVVYQAGLTTMITLSFVCDIVEAVRPPPP